MENIKKNNTDDCVCHNREQYLLINRNSSTKITAFFLFFTCFIFMVGFFFGKQRALDALVEDLDQQAFSDQLQHSMMMLYGDISSTELPEQAPLDLVFTNTDTRSTTKEDYYFVQIKSFSVLKDAQNFVARLQKKGISSTIIKRESKQANSKKLIPWYYINTQTYANEEEANSISRAIQSNDSHLRIAVLKK